MNEFDFLITALLFLVSVAFFFMLSKYIALVKRIAQLSHVLNGFCKGDSVSFDTPPLASTKTLEDSIIRLYGLFSAPEGVHVLSAAKLRAILDHTFDAIITINSEGLIRIFNRSSERLFGYTHEEVVGQNVSMLMTGSLRDQHNDAIKRYEETGEARIIGIGREVKGCKKNGEEFDLEIAITKVPWEGETIYCGIMRDISRRKSIESELARSNEDLDRFASTIAHDMKQPLRGIRNQITMCIEDCGQHLPTDALKRLERIKRLAASMTALIEELLGYSRVGSTPFIQEMVDTYEVVKSITVEVKASSNVEFQISKDLPIVRGIPVLIEQLFRNLIENGIIHNDSTNKIIEVGTQPGTPHVFFVADNGKGISESEKETLFSPLPWARTVPGERHKRGLAIVNKIISRHKGAIWVNSNPGNGSTFFFRLE